jgi:hypothetical protein
MLYKLTRVSGNRKTGPIPVSLSSRDTCPDSCSLKRNGCYAESWPLSKHWTDCDKGKGSTDLEQFCAGVAALPKGQLWRHNQAGDLPGRGDTLDTSSLDAIVAANNGRRGFTYTHKPLRNLSERAAVWRANRAGFTINLSAEGLADADRLASFGAGPVVAGVSTDHPAHSKTPAGLHVIVCPAQTREDMSCDRCGLCALPNRKAIIAFRAHGTSSRKATNVFLRVLQ